MPWCASAAMGASNHARPEAEDGFRGAGNCASNHAQPESESGVGGAGNCATSHLRPQQNDDRPHPEAERLRAYAFHWSKASFATSEKTTTSSTPRTNSLPFRSAMRAPSRPPARLNTAMIAASCHMTLPW